MDLDGKKTYIVGVLILLAAILGSLTKVIEAKTVAVLISISLTAMGIRHGIQKDS